MALRVWLPLNGTLENQGCSEIAVTNHNATVDNSGKIGKCYLLNGTNAYINGTYNATQEISFCCWANFPSIKSAHLFDARTSGGTGYQPMYVTASSIQIGASGSNYANFSQSFSNNTWYHICVTHSATEGKCYINGNLIGTSTAAKGVNMGTCAFTLGSRCNQSNYQNAKINDVRIYDHCLSAAEVKEISYGLVLHYKLDDITNGIVDSSGYGHNGTIIGTATLTSSPRYSNGISMNNTSTANRIDATSLPTEVSTVSLWVKGAKATNQVYFADKNSGLEFGTYSSLGATNLSSKALYNLTDFVNNEWNHIVVIKDSTNNKLYINGKLATTSSSNNYYTHNGGLYLFNRNANNNYACNGSISDFRAYCTILSEEDILSLYHTAAKVDNLGGLHTFEAIENIPNIIFKIDSARGAKVFQDGLSRYTQANCQVTLTDDGYRIYRPPNLTTSANGNTMWGGLKLVNQNTDTVSPYNATRDNIWGLQQGHTYLWAFHAKGQSNNATSFGFTNNMGWGVGGVSPGPTVLVNDGIPANFQGEKECLCIFTIGDNIIKTSNDNRGGYDGSSQYLSYRHLTFGWGYSSTGELGTDVYLTNLRLYDITNFIGQIKKNGQANFSDFVENNSIARILKNAEFLTNNLIEK